MTLADVIVHIREIEEAARNMPDYDVAVAATMVRELADGMEEWVK